MRAFHDRSVDAVIIDVDGKLHNVSGIRDYVTLELHQRNYDAFHAASALCQPRPDVLEQLGEHEEAGHIVIVVTARKRRWKYLTRRWLRKWGVECSVLATRADDDQHPDVQVKADNLSKLRARGFNIAAAIDDVLQVIASWETQGIPVTQVSGWEATL